MVITAISLIIIGCILLLAIVIPIITVNHVYRESFFRDALRAAERFLGRK